MLVRLVKGGFKGQHCGPNDIQMQTLVRALTAMTQLHNHNSSSKLLHTPGMQHSADLVGDERRELLSEIVTAADPFNESRAPVKDFHFKSKGSPAFNSFSLLDATKFVNRVKKNFSCRYPRLSHKGST